VETDRHVYVVEVKTRPKIADVGALLAKLLAEKYRRYKRVRRTAVPLHEWVAAVAPTSRLLEMAALLEKAAPTLRN